MTIPFSSADVCWCQPFNGPQHPNCPMHGFAANRPPRASESAAKPAQFVAVGTNVMQGSQRMASANSHTFARRIANALNRYQHNARKGY